MPLTRSASCRRSVGRRGDHDAFWRGPGSGPLFFLIFFLTSLDTMTDEGHTDLITAVVTGRETKEMTMASRMIQVMETGKYLELVAAYENSFRDQEESEIRARIRKCEIACQQVGAYDCYNLRRNARARFVLANLHAMEDAAPFRV